MSSKLCNSAFCHLVARPPNMVATAGTFPVFPYVCVLEGQGRGVTLLSVYTGRGPFPLDFIPLKISSSIFIERPVLIISGWPEPNTFEASPRD